MNATGSGGANSPNHIKYFTTRSLQLVRIGIHSYNPGLVLVDMQMLLHGMQGEHFDIVSMPIMANHLKADLATMSNHTKSLANFGVSMIKLNYGKRIPTENSHPSPV